jgi:asparagine synthase (glutamine-hydrolysing)
MCGIVGALSLNGTRLDEEVITTMRQQLVHRGPDDQGLYVDSNLGLGHVRLSIIDLSPLGHQPMSNASSNTWVVYNGEIYNFEEVRDDLEKLGHRFRSRTDTEVIIHAYDQWGENLVERLNGMFAFALWDRRRKKLSLFRDRLGVKPLFYYLDRDQLLFASEIKSILKYPGIDRQLNWQAISDFLSMNYVAPPLTPFLKIKALPPAHYLTYQNGRSSLFQYWDVQFHSKKVRDEQEYIERIEDKLKRCVKRRLVSDVPLGAFLSGGLDSSSVVYFMREFLAGTLKTFNVSFSESSYDEAEFAKLLARKLNTTHFEVYCGPHDLKRHFDELVLHSDSLSADNSNLAVYLVSRLARQHVKVVLTGDGGDETFGGYPTYQADLLAHYYRKLPSVVRASLFKRLIALLPSSDRKLSWEFRLKRFVEGAEHSPAKAHYWWRIVFDDNQKQQLLRHDCFPLFELRDSSEGYSHHYNLAEGAEALERSFYSDIKVFLAGSILSKVDTMTMAHSLEGRSPFLDYELVEDLAKVPVSLKIRGSDTKYLLKKIMANKLPAEIIRRKKSGFNLPLGKWFREDLKDFVNEVLSQPDVSSLGFLNWDFVDRLKKEHFSGSRNHDYRLWGLMNLVRWHQQFCR